MSEVSYNRGVVRSESSLVTTRVPLTWPGDPVRTDYVPPSKLWFVTTDVGVLSHSSLSSSRRDYLRAPGQAELLSVPWGPTDSGVTGKVNGEVTRPSVQRQKLP